MRTIKSLKNATSAIISNIVSMLLGLISQFVFIRTLGNECLGINSLFSNIIYMLNIVELGFGSAIVYNMYKPIADNNQKELKSLLKFYKKAYNTIAIIILVIGFAIMPFLTSIIGEISININIYIIFILFLLDSVFSYVLTYKRSILYASQNSYIINIIHIGYLVSVNAFTIFVLYLTSNYYLYLIIKIILRILENICINIIVKRKYPYTSDNDIIELDDEKKKSIIKKIKALFFHKIGEVMILGTDSVIISKYVGIITLGLYSNYNMIISSITNLFGQAFSAITSSVGNLLVEENNEKSYTVYKKIVFLNFWLSSFCTIAIFCIMEPFIKFWLGYNYLLSKKILLILALVFYMQTMKRTLKIFKEANGEFEKDKFIPIIESLINIVVSIILAKKIGLIGVFIGTLLSTIVLYVYSFPKLVYKNIFQKRYAEYFIEYLKYGIIMSLTLAITYLFTFILNFKYIIIKLIVNIIICLIIPNAIYYILFKKTEELKYYKNAVLKIFKKIRRKKYE